MVPLADKEPAPMKKFILAAALAGTALGGAAIAGQDATATSTPMHHRGHGDRMMKLDTNKDGVITRDEAMAAADARFAKGDTDGNGQITREETKARFEAMKAKRMERRAAHGDAAKAPRLDPEGKPIARMGHRHGHGGKGRMMQRIDTNKDDMISRDENRAMAGQHFDKMDANKDGRIDQAEIQAMKAQMQAKRAEMRAKWQARKAAAAPSADSQ